MTGFVARLGIIRTHLCAGLPELLEQSPAKLELAKARAALGESLLAAGDKSDARTLLASALELAEKCGLRAESVEQAVSEAAARPAAPAASAPPKNRLLMSICTPAKLS